MVQKARTRTALSALSENPKGNSKLVFSFKRSTGEQRKDSPMNRLLILFCMAGWAIYIIHLNASSAGALSALLQNGKAFAEPADAEQTAKASKQSQLQRIASSGMQSPHAIVPDETTPQPAANSALPLPQTEATHNPTLLSDPGQDLSAQREPSPEPGERLRVRSETSIRSGPSASAQVIGRAHRGAELQVKSRESGWVQFVDASANKSGWISSAYLAPADHSATVESTMPTRPKQPPKVAILKSPKPIPKVRPVPPTYAELPVDQEFMQSRRRGLFGLFWKRRANADTFAPPPYR